MIIQNSTEDKRVKNVRKTATAGENGITWDSTGLNDFIVLIGDSNERVVIKDEFSEVVDYLSSVQAELIEKEAVSIPTTSITAYRVSFAQLKQQGGFSANGKPGVYAVYGVDIKNGEMVLYVQENNLLQVAISITINIAPVYSSKRAFGIFKTGEKYSGYKEISILKAVPGVSGNSLYYMVGSKPYKYPFPDDTVKNGGSFYVKCNENENITYSTINKEVIRFR